MGNHLSRRLMIKLWRKLERIKKTLEEDREVDVAGMEENGNAGPLVESEANVGNANAENHLVAAGKFAPKKVLIQKTKDKNVEKVKN